MAIELEPPEPDLSNIRKHLKGSPSLMRLAIWGGLAILGLGVMAVIIQTQTGSERLQQALLALAGEPTPSVARIQPALPEPQRVAEKDIETRRLEAQVRALEADRDRLNVRLAMIERGLDDVTGSIKKQVEQVAATRSPILTTLPPMVALSPPPATVPSAPPPVKTAAVAPPPPPPPAPPQAIAAPELPPPEEPARIAMPASAPLPDPVPLPPVRVAALANEPAATRPRFEYGVDLGGGATIDALRARWAGVKANHGPLLGGLHPVAARDRRPGSTDYRLVVGPVASVTAARQLCERFAAAQAACRAAKYDGEELIPR